MPPKKKRDAGNEESVADQERKRLTKKYTRLLQASIDDDMEERHQEFDSVLCQLLKELGYDEVVELYNSVDMWYA